ncbi:MAG: response regulator transcription factor [Atopobiaceae bacterium]|nr:response regulator transcription factor [Atopobiaceae bacterium]
MNILIVEDERPLANAISHILKSDGYNTTVAYDGLEGLEHARQGGYDVLVLDVMLPGMSGFDIVHELRHSGDSTPTLILTARNATDDKVTGLDSGADDYMTKPFEAAELLARIRALARRQGDVVIDEIGFGDLTLDLNSHDLSCGENSVHLSHKEFDVLRLLMTNTSRVITKAELLTSVWGSENETSENSAEVYVSFLRKKISSIGSKVLISTLRMLGYRLEMVSDIES